MNWIDSLDCKFGRHSIPHLMYFITGVMLAVYVTDLVLGGQVSAALYFDRSLILRGEVWRLVTFLFLPPNSSSHLDFVQPLFLLPDRQRAGKCLGQLPLQHLLPGGRAGRRLLRADHRLRCKRISQYVPLSGLCRHLSRPSGAGVLLPAHQKSNGWPCWTPCILSFAFFAGGWPSKLAILFALLNIVLFFGGDLLRNAKQQAGFWKTRYNFRKNNRRY